MRHPLGGRRTWPPTRSARPPKTSWLAFSPWTDRTTAPADVVLPVWALGAAYLGGTRLRAMAKAGLITETPGSLAALSTAMSWEAAPHDLLTGIRHGQHVMRQPRRTVSGWAT